MAPSAVCVHKFSGNRGKSDARVDPEPEPEPVWDLAVLMEIPVESNPGQQHQVCIYLLWGRSSNDMSSTSSHLPAIYFTISHVEDAGRLGLEKRLGNSLKTEQFQQVGRFRWIFRVTLTPAGWCGSLQPYWGVSIPCNIGGWTRRAPEITISWKSSVFGVTHLIKWNLDYRAFVFVILMILALYTPIKPQIQSNKTRIMWEHSGN